MDDQSTALSAISCILIGCGDAPMEWLSDVARVSETAQNRGQFAPPPGRSAAQDLTPRQAVLKEPTFQRVDRLTEAVPRPAVAGAA